jgi:hypothetical protein
MNNKEKCTDLQKEGRVSCYQVRNYDAILWRDVLSQCQVIEVQKEPSISLAGKRAFSFT